MYFNFQVEVNGISATGSFNVDDEEAANKEFTDYLKKFHSSLYSGLRDKKNAVRLYVNETQVRFKSVNHKEGRLIYKPAPTDGDADEPGL